MISLAALILCGATAYGLARLVRADALPFLLLAGFALGRLPLPIPQGLLEQTMVAGLSLLVFLAGKELNPHRMGPYVRLSGVAAALRICGVAAAGFGLGLLFGLPPTGALVAGIVLGSSSPVVAVRLLGARREFFEASGRVAAGVLLYQGLLFVLVLAVLGQAQEGTRAAALAVVFTLILLGLSLVVMRWGATRLVTRLELDEETVLLVIFAFLAVFMSLAHVLGLPLVGGAFLAGLALSRFPVNGMIRGYLASTGDLAAALTFTSLGALLVVPVGVDLALSLTFALAVMVLSPLLLSVLGRFGGLTTRPAFRSGVLLGQTGEFGMSLAMQAAGLGLLVAGPTLDTLLFATAITLFLTPALSKGHWVWDAVTWPLRRAKSAGVEAADHILVVGLHSTDRPLLDRITEAGGQVVVVDDDPGQVAKVRGLPGVTGVLADGTRRLVLEGTGHGRARAVVVSLRPFNAAERVIRRVGTDPGRPVIVRVRTTDEAARVHSLGGIPALWADPIAADILAWLEGTA